MWVKFVLYLLYIIGSSKKGDLLQNLKIWSLKIGNPWLRVMTSISQGYWGVNQVMEPDWWAVCTGVFSFQQFIKLHSERHMHLSLRIVFSKKNFKQQREQAFCFPRWFTDPEVQPVYYKTHFIVKKNNNN